MPRPYEIRAAFIEAIQQNPKGYRYLSTTASSQVTRKNCHFSQVDANQWIERNQPDFADKTTDGSENRYWILRNMGRVF
jgi:hypothetical protein